MKRVLVVLTTMLAFSASHASAQYRDPDDAPDAGAAVGAAIVGGLLGAAVGAAIGGGHSHHVDKAGIMEHAGAKGGGGKKGGGTPGGGPHKRKPGG